MNMEEKFSELSLTSRKGKSDLQDGKEIAEGDAESEEDWEKEMEGVVLTSYDPMKKVIKNNIAINTKCKSVGERKDIRAMQRVVSQLWRCK